MLKTTENRYVVTDSEILNGEPIITNTRTPIRAIVEMWRSGTASEEITQGLPHLTLAQVFDALSYYRNNQEQINHYIKLNLIPDSLIDSLLK